LNGSPNQQGDAASTRAAGSFRKLRYGMARQQTITEALAVSAVLSGQSADKNLDSSEKFYLGGSSGVRAYPSSEAGGASGQLLNLELRARLPEGLMLVGFYDWGHVTQNRDDHFSAAPAPNSYHLQGAGLVLGWISSYRLNLKATWARRIGSNPGANLSGRDQDGSLNKNRFWLQASMPF
jgi:hemolysin activation/secretion protein